MTPGAFSLSKNTEKVHYQSTALGHGHLWQTTTTEQCAIIHRSTAPFSFHSSSCISVTRDRKKVKCRVNEQQQKGRATVEQRRRRRKAIEQTHFVGQYLRIAVEELVNGSVCQCLPVCLFLSAFNYTKLTVQCSVAAVCLYHLH